MLGPHRSPVRFIHAVRGVARAVVVYALSLALVGANTDLVSADDAIGTALPRFVDAQSLDSLRHALLTPPQHAPKATADAIMPRFHGGTAVGDGGAMAAAKFAPIGLISNGDVTTTHFQQTLTGARREAGEARELADEVRRRAEELTQRFASDSQAHAAPTPSAAARVGLPAAAVATLTAAPSVAGDAAALSTDGPSAGIDYREDDVSPVAGLPLTPATGAATAPAGLPQPAAVPALIASPPGLRTGATGVQRQPSSATDGDANTKRATANPVSEPRKRSLATAGSSAAPVRKRTKAATVGSHRTGTERPVARERLAKTAAQPADTDNTASPDAEPVPPTSNGGLLSWLKPFAFPKELGSLGWASGE